MGRCGTAASHAAYPAGRLIGVWPLRWVVDAATVGNNPESVRLLSADDNTRFVTLFGGLTRVELA